LCLPLFRIQHCCAQIQKPQPLSQFFSSQSARKLARSPRTGTAGYSIPSRAQQWPTEAEACRWSKRSQPDLISLADLWLISIFPGSNWSTRLIHSGGAHSADCRRTALHCTALLPVSCAPAPTIQAGWHRHRPRRPDRWIRRSNRRAWRPRLHPPRRSASGPAAAVTSVTTDSYTRSEEETSACAIWRNASTRRGEEQWQRRRAAATAGLGLGDRRRTAQAEDRGAERSRTLG